jgi:hypothetical protein
VEKFQREEIDVIGDLIQSRAKRVIQTSVTCLSTCIIKISLEQTQLEVINECDQKKFISIIIFTTSYS